MGQSLGRLKRRAEFLTVAKSRLKHVAPGFVLQARARDHLGNTDDGAIRVGFTTGRKIGNAVRRNLARRRLREAARLVIPSLGTQGTDYVLIGRQDTATMSFAQLRGDLEEAISILNKKQSARTNG